MKITLNINDHPSGTRFLGVNLIEFEIVSWSPSGKYVKLKKGDSPAFWQAVVDINHILEIL
jgi:hypothetical protein